MIATNPHGVKAGQVWADNDKRSAGRRVKVLAIRGTRAEVVAVDLRGNPNPDAVRARRTRIRLDRFQPTATGYRLVSEASDA